jgi:hypothetical protein
LVRHRMFCAGFSARTRKRAETNLRKVRVRQPMFTASVEFFDPTDWILSKRRRGLQVALRSVDTMRVGEWDKSPWQAHVRRDADFCLRGR